eukprot:COSAG01_NODE_879_length_12944_cov_9.811021_7_plen_282_part_00
MGASCAAAGKRTVHIRGGGWRQGLGRRGRMWRRRWRWRVRITVEGRLERHERPGLAGRALAAAAHAPALDLPAGRGAKYAPAPVRDPDCAVRVAAEALTEHAAGTRDLPAHRACVRSGRTERGGVQGRGEEGDHGNPRRLQSQSLEVNTWTPVACGQWTACGGAASAALVLLDETGTVGPPSVPLLLRCSFTAEPAGCAAEHSWCCCAAVLLCLLSIRDRPHTHKHGHAARRRPAVHAPKILMTAACAAGCCWLLLAAPRRPIADRCNLCPFVITRRGLAR